jgi:hypothetical protein
MCSGFWTIRLRDNSLTASCEHCNERLVICCLFEYLTISRNRFLLKKCVTTRNCKRMLMKIYSSIQADVNILEKYKLQRIASQITNIINRKRKFGAEHKCNSQ